METQSRIPASLSDAPILVGGYPRSGTTLLSAMLACAPHHIQGFEIHLRKPSFVTGLGGRYTRNIFSALGLPEDEYESILKATDSPPMNPGAWTGPVDFITGEAPTGTETEQTEQEFAARADLTQRLLERLAEIHMARSWGFKILGDIAHADLYAHVWPNARFVTIHRDPCDVLPSTLAHLMPHLQETDEDRTEALRTLAKEWNSTITAWRNATAHSVKHHIEVRYEDLVTHPQQTLAAIGKFTNLNLEQARGYHTNSMVLRHAKRYNHLSGLRHPLNSNAIGKGRQALSSLQRQVIEDECGETMASLDYLA